MVSIQPHLLPLVAFFLLLAAIASVDATLPNFSFSDFMTKSCSATSHPRLCKRALSPFLRELKKEDLSVLVETSVSLAASISRRVNKRIYKMSLELNTTKAGVDPKVLDAVTFCVTYHNDTAGQLKLIPGMVKNIIGMGERDGTEFDDPDLNFFYAIGYLDQCLDMWKTLPDVQIKTDVCGLSRKVLYFANNARELLTSLKNELVNPVSPPPANCKDCVCCPGQDLKPGQCCECCTPEPLPWQAPSPERQAEKMCDKGDLDCIKFFMEN